MIVPINLRRGEQRIDFRMDLDPNVLTDHAVLHYTNQGMPCEPESCYVMMRFLKEGMTAIDGGANVGFFTLLMSALVGEKGQVLAFEPGQNNLSKLKTNLALNDCCNVKVIEQPLWSSVTSVKMFHYEDGGANSLWSLFSGDKAVEMATTTLDAECERADLIKLDIEGAEVRALRGAYKMLRHHPFVLTEINEGALERAGASFQELRKMLREHDCFALSETGHFPTLIPPSVHIVPCKPNTNVMFARLADVAQAWNETHI